MRFIALKDKSQCQFKPQKYEDSVGKKLVDGKAPVACLIPIHRLSVHSQDIQSQKSQLSTVNAKQLINLLTIQIPFISINTRIFFHGLIRVVSFFFKYVFPHPLYLPWCSPDSFQSLLHRSLPPNQTTTRMFSAEVTSLYPVELLEFPRQGSRGGKTVSS